MKKLILFIAVLAFVGAGCSSNTETQEAAHEHGPDTHQHGGDGHQHGSEAGHDESQPHGHAEEAAAPRQEEFTLEQDSTQANPAGKPHQHEGGEPHTH